MAVREKETKRMTVKTKSPTAVMKYRRRNQGRRDLVSKSGPQNSYH